MRGCHLPTPSRPPPPLRRSTALINTVVIGAVNVGCTVIAVLAVDRFGRRFLLVEGGIQCCIMMIIVGEPRPPGAQVPPGFCLPGRRRRKIPAAPTLPCPRAAAARSALAGCAAVA